MSEYEWIDPLSSVARIKDIDYEESVLYLEFPNGNFTTVGIRDLDEFEVGSIVLVRLNDNYIEVVSDELWPEHSWVGVVRLKLPDVTIVDSRGHWIKLPTHDDIPYREGNTVEAKSSVGVIRVLSEDPIKYLDLPTVDDSVIAKFRTEVGEHGEGFEDFGGLKDVVDRARELIEVPLMHEEELTKIGARPIKGVLFTGLPGTGKTMLARIIANNTNSVFYEVSGPQVFSKWYGQSEEIVRKLFEDAGKQEKAIIFFDEIDSIAGKRDDDSHEVSRRVVAQLLTLMDGFTPNDKIIVIAATNRPQDIDVALRRPGRFDWEVNFPLPSRQDREEILRVSARQLATSENLPHEWMAKNTETWSAAELTAIWSEAALLAAADKRSVIITEDYIGGFKLVLAQRHRAGLVTKQGGNTN